MQELSREDVTKIKRDLMRKAATDEDFRQLALSDPKAAIKQVSGIDLPSNLRIRFMEPQEGESVFMLPPRMSAGREMSDEELETSAGGKGGPVLTPDPQPTQSTGAVVIPCRCSTGCA
jgi:hypothetical protein